jgi:hypothetical protein
MRWTEVIAALGEKNAMLKSVLYLVVIEKETETEITLKVRHKLHEDLLNKSSNKQMLAELLGKKIVVEREKKIDTALANVAQAKEETIGGYQVVDNQAQNEEKEVMEVMRILS